MLVLDALRPTRGAARITKSQRRVLADFGPLKMRGFPLNKRFVVDGFRQARGPIFKSGFGRHHDPFYRRNPPAQFFEERQRIGIGNNQSITGMIDDVFEIGF